MESKSVGGVNPSGLQPGKHTKKMKPDKVLFNITDSFKRGEGKKEPVYDIEQAARVMFTENRGTNINTTWIFDLDDKISVSPVSDGRDSIITGDKSGNVYAVDNLTGERKWKHNTGGNITALVTDKSDNTVFAAFGTKASKPLLGGLSALDPDTGKPIWNFKTEAEIQSMNVVGENLIIKSHNNVYLVNKITGKPANQHRLDNVHYYRFHVPFTETMDGLLVTGGDTDSVFAIDPGTGEKKWEFEIKASVCRHKACASSDDTIIFGANDRRVYAVDARTGKKKWDFQKEVYGNEYYDTYAGPVTTPDGTVIISSSDHYLYALDGKTGEKKWQTPTGERETGFAQTPALDKSGNIFVGRSDGKVVAFGGDSGKKIGEFNTDHRIYPTLPFKTAPDGTVLVSSGDKLYALRTGMAQQVESEKMKEGETAGNKKKLTIEKDGGFVNIGGVKLEVQNLHKET